MSKSFNDLKSALAKSVNIAENCVELPYLRKKAIYRPMRNKELKDFLKAIEKKDEYLINASLDSILESCVSKIDDEPFDVNTLCMQDRTFLLVKIKQATRGNMVKFLHAYNEDKDPVEVELDLNDFDVTYQDEEIEETLNLTNTVKITIGLATRKSEKELENWLKRYAVKNSIADRRYSSYATLITKVEMLDDSEDESDGKTWQNVDLSFAEKVKVVEDFCSSKDIEKLDELIEKMDFGVKLTFNFQHEDYSNENEEINLLSFFII